MKNPLVRRIFVSPFFRWGNGSSGRWSNLPKSQERSWNLFMDCLSPQPDHLSTISSRLSSSLPLSIVSWGGPQKGLPEGKISGQRRSLVRREESKFWNWRRHNTCWRYPDGDTRSAHCRRDKPPAFVTHCKLSPNHSADRDGFPGLTAQLSFLRHLMGERRQLVYLWMLGGNFLMSLPPL